MNGNRISFNELTWRKEYLLSYDLFYYGPDTRALPCFNAIISIAENARM